MQTDGDGRPNGAPVQADAPSRAEREALWAWAESRPARLRAIGEERARIVGEVITLMRARGCAFLEAARVIAAAHGITAAAIRNWYYGANGKPGCRRWPREDWPAVLIPGWGGGRRPAEITPEAWEFFKADYLRLERPSLASCYRRLVRVARERGWQVPSMDALRRRLAREIPRIVQVILREGEEAAFLSLPHQERDAEALAPLAWITGDGYRHDVLVEWPDGEVGRPITWVWMDVRTRRVLAWRTAKTESKDLIRLAFADLIRRHGIPGGMIIDNTLAAANKELTARAARGRKRFREDENDPEGLFAALGVEVRFTSVIRTAGGRGKGLGRAKPVERFFGIGGLMDECDRDPRLAGAYLGNHPRARPENAGVRPVPLAVFERVLADAIRAYNARPSRSALLGGESPDAAWARLVPQAQIRRATEAQVRMFLLAGERVRVARDGTVRIKALGAPGVGAPRYAHDRLTDFVGQEVVARFDPDDAERPVAIYTLDGRFLCEAELVEKAGFADREAARAWARERRRKLRAARAMAEAERRMRAEEVGALLDEVAPPEAGEPGPGVIAGVFGRVPRREDEEQEEFEERFIANVSALRERWLREREG